MSDLKPRSRILLLLVSGLFLCFMEYIFLDIYEYAPRIHHRNFYEEAGKNNLLALEYFLKKNKITVNKLSTIEPIFSKLQTQDILLFSAETENLSERYVKNLLDWVRRGGKLWLRAPEQESNTEEKSLLMQQFGVYRESFPYEQKYDLDADSLKNKIKTAVAVPIAQKIIWNQVSFPVFFKENYRLKMNTALVQTTQTGADAQGTRLAQFKVGQGEVLFFSEWEWLENAMLGRYQHAYLLWHLLPQTLPTVWITEFSLTEEDDDLFALWHKFKILGSSLLVGVIFLLWYLGHRFGALILLPQLSRRRLLEHIEASGYFLWRHQQAAILLHTVREQVLQRIYHKYPDWQTFKPAELVEALAQRSDLSAVDIHRALFNNLQDNSQHTVRFTDTIRILAILRKAL